MRAVAILGVVIAALGLASLVYEGVAWTEEETVLKLGPLEAEAENTKSVAIPPAAGIGAVVVGVALFAIGWRRSR